MADPEEPLEIRSERWQSLKGLDIASVDLGPICVVLLLTLICTAVMLLLAKSGAEQVRQAQPSPQAKGAAPRPQPAQPVAEPAQQQTWIPALRT
ncbi:hypothetical protein [Delftia sp. PE138]|uniref:hypothetical protein n=1 Tax=Delftia sp. PE138 TaxID=1812483 RepID=UPI001BB0D528|nr:hypothetical protein [Delftia sp. PE138]MBS3720858.1 hypothetical protein [Delftia sp. PE138]